MEVGSAVLLPVALSTPTAKAPFRASPGAAGLDLYASENATIPPRNRVLVSTGISIQIPTGCWGEVKARSGLSVKGIDVGAGTIDNDYRGEVKVLLINTDNLMEYRVERGDRIAQLVVQQYVPVVPLVVDSLTETGRAAGGFGSTGV